MDNIDIQILDCLKKNARQNASAISAEINLSVSAVIERIKKLESGGLIQQYSIVLDPQKIGMGILAFISVGIEHPKYNEDFREAMVKKRQVVECHYVTGDFDYLLKVMAGSTQDLEKVLDEVKGIKGVSVTKTLVVFSTIKNDLCVLPEMTV